MKLKGASLASVMGATLATKRSSAERLKEGVDPNALVVAGKTYDGEDTTITLTMEQLEQMESDPAEVFKSFCREEMGQEATDHFLQLFAQAVEEADAE